MPQHQLDTKNGKNISYVFSVFLYGLFEKKLFSNMGMFGNYVAQKMEFLDPSPPSVTTFEWFPVLKNHTA